MEEWVLIRQEGLSPCIHEPPADNLCRAPVPRCCRSMGCRAFPKGSPCPPPPPPGIVRIRQKRVFSLFSRRAARGPHLPAGRTWLRPAEESPGCTGCGGSVPKWGRLPSVQDANEHPEQSYLFKSFLQRRGLGGSPQS